MANFFFLILDFLSKIIKYGVVEKKYVDNLLFCLDCKGELENPLT